MALMFNNSGGGKVTLQSPDSGEYKLTFPDTSGSNGFFLQTDGKGNLSWAPAGTGSMPDGNKSTPGLTFVGDKDTGFFRPSANTIGVSTTGQQRMLVDDKGNVVITSGEVGVKSNDGFLYLPTTFGVPCGEPTLYIGGAAVVVDKSNNVLYGYNSDTRKWINLTTGLGGAPGGQNKSVQYNTEGTFSGYEHFTFDEETNTLSIPTVAVGDGSNSSPSYTFDDNDNTGMYSAGVDNVSFATNGNLRLSLTNTGNVVVGQTALPPTATDGFLYITGMPGSPSGTPTRHIGRHPITFDYAAKTLYVHDGEQWQTLSSPRIKTDKWSLTPTIDWSNADIVRMILTGNTAFTFVGGVDGHRYMLELTQDEIGKHIVHFAKQVRFPAESQSYFMTQTPTRTDRLEFIYNEPTQTYDVIAVNKGF